MTESITTLLLKVPLTNPADEVLAAIPSVPKSELKLALKALTYPEFLLTRYWQAVAETVKNRAKRACQICNSPSFL